MATAQPIKLSKENIAEFLTLEEQRRSLESQARAIESRTAPIKEALKTALRSSGKTSCVKLGYRLTFIPGRANISWKEEFVRVAGPEEADRITKVAPKTQQLDVQPAHAPAA